MKLALLNIFTRIWISLTVILLTGALTTANAQCPDVDTGLTISPTSITVCPNESFDITIFGSEGSTFYRVFDGATAESLATFGGGDITISTFGNYTTSTILTIEADNISADCPGELLTQTITVTVALPSPPSATDPSPICVGDAIPTLSATGSGTIRWYSDAGLTNQIGVGSSFTPSQPVVDNTTAGTYSVYVTDEPGSCESGDTKVDVVVEDQPVADAGSGGFSCNYDFNLSANPSIGTGSWSQVSGPGTSTFVPGGANTTVTVTQYGSYVFRWTEDNNGCISTDDITVDFFEQPVANAGSGGDACGFSFVLSAVQSVGSSTGTWSFSGPGNASFSNINDPSATATVDAYGAYTFTWTEANGGCTDADDVIVNYYEQPVADAGSGGTECDMDFVFSANASVGTGTWSLISGPGTPTYSDINSATSTVDVTAFGTYIFQWTEDNNGCTDADQVVVNFFEQPVADAGSDANECDLDHLLQASPSVGTGSWALLSGPGTANFDDASSGTTNVSVSVVGTYVFLWTEVNGSCVDSDQVTVVFSTQPVANAGLDGDECDLNFTFNASPSVGTGTWTQISGPGTSAFTNPNGPTATVNVTAYGTYIFEWSENNNGCTDADQVTVVFTEEPAANAGIDENTCSNSFTFSATPSVGSGTWTQVSGPGTTSFDDATSPNAAATVTAFGTYVYEWSEVNGGCADSDQVTITYTELPVADAGTGGDECDLNFALNANPTVGTGIWTQVSGPGVPSFSNASSPVSTVSVSLYGTYVFRWTETNGVCSDQDEITVNFFQQPVANAGTDGDECDLDFTFAAVPSVGTGTWSQISGPGSSTFGDTNSPTSTVDVTAYGTYQFQWSENNNGCSDSDVVTVVFNEQPVANAGSDDITCGFVYAMNPATSVGAGTWSQVSGPSVATFDNVNVPTTNVTVSTEGVYIFQWTEDNNGCVSIDQVSIEFIEQPVADAGAGGDACGVSFLLDAQPSVLGSIGTWTVTSLPSGGAGVSFNNINSPNATVTVTEFGTYEFTWTEDNNGCDDVSSVIVNFFEEPVANAGPDNEVCSLLANLAAVPSVGTGTWSQVSGPGSTTFSSASDPATSATVTTYGTYIYAWTEDNSGCSSADQVTVVFNQQPVANAGIGGDVCGQDFLLNATPSVFGSIGVWTVTVQPPSSNVTFNNANSPNATVSVDVYGSYEFTWTETNGSCASNSAVTVNFYEEPVADAGTGGESCGLEFTFSAVSSVGTGTWSQVSGPGTSSFDNSNDPAATVTATAYGTYTYRWTEVNSTCSDYEEITVTLSNQPVANAGAGGDVCGFNFTFSASPSVFGSIGQWTVVNTPSPSANVSFNNANSPNATVTVDEYGDYEFMWTETNGGCSDAENITVGFYEVPVAEAGPVAEVCDLTTNLQATASVGTGTWTQISGPGTATFASANDPLSQVDVSNYGTYVFEWEVVNNVCSDADQVTITFNQQPVANAGSNDSVCGLGYLLSATPSVFGSIGSWVVTSTPTGSETATFNNPNSPTASVSVSGYGAYEFTWTETNGTCVDAASVVIEFFEEPVAKAGPGGETCSLLFTLDAQPSVGTGTWSQISGPGTTTFDNINLATATATATAYGTYVYAWTENNSLCGDTDQVTVVYSQQPVANAGVGGDICGTSYLLNAAPSVFGSIGQWTVVASPSASANATFNNPNSPNATVTIDEFGTYEFEWTETNGGCSDAASVIVNFYEIPVADAGFDNQSCGLDYTMSATPSVGTGIWTLINGPGTVTFDDATSPTAIATVSIFGQYVFAWTETNAVCSDSEEITIRFNEAPLITGVDNQGADYCEPASVLISGTIGGGASTANWSLVSGGTGTLSASSLTGNQVSANYLPAPGEYGPVVFALTTDDSDGTGPCTSATETLTININQAPVVDAGADFGVCEDAGFAQLNGAIGGSATTATWSGGLGTFDNVNDPATRYNFDPSEIGSTVVLTLTVSDPDGSGPCTLVEDQVAVSINPLPVVDYFNLPAIVNQGQDSIILVGNQSGGNFTISPSTFGLGPVFQEDGFDKVIFFPADTDLGINTITYTFTDANGCTNSASKNVTVNPVSSVTFSIESDVQISTDSLRICNNAGQLELRGTPPVSSGNPGTEFRSATPGLVSLTTDNRWVVNTDGLLPGVYSIEYYYINSFNVPSPNTKTIIVVGSPDVLFAVGATCITAPVQFTDQTTVPVSIYPNAINAWDWEFGDGAKSTEQNPLYDYDDNDIGSKDVTLTVTTTLGCTGVLSQPIYLSIEPEVSFNASTSCGDDPSRFLDLTEFDALDPVASYTWNFGDGNSVNQASGTQIPAGTNGGRTEGPIESPTHDFAGSQTYTSELIVTTFNGCIASTTRQVSAQGLVVVPEDGLLNEFDNAFDAGWSPEPNNPVNSWVLNSGHVYPENNDMWWTGKDDGTYYDLEDSYISSPCYDINALTKPMIHFDLYYDAQAGQDGLVLQYSTDGNSWMNIGDVDHGIEWFNALGIAARPGAGDAPDDFNAQAKGWTGQSAGLVSARFNLNQIPPSNRDKVQFRMAFASDGGLSDGSVGFDNFYIGNKEREVLLESFTDDAVPDAISATQSVQAVRSAQINNGSGYTDATVLEYHLNIVDPADDYHSFNPDDARMRQAFYGVNQVPSLYMDGMFYRDSSLSLVDTIAMDIRGLTDPEFDIQIVPVNNPEPDIIRFEITVEALQDMMNIPLQLNVAMVENITGGPDNVMRKMVLTREGNFISDGVTWTAGTVQTYTAEWALGLADADYTIQDPTQVQILAFVQNSVSREVYQSAAVDAPDKTYGVITGLEDDLKGGKLRVYPNPATTYLRIAMPDDIIGDFEYRLIDLRGVTIRQGEIDRRYGDFILDTSDVINGVYHLQIMKGNAPVAQRKVMILQ